MFRTKLQFKKSGENQFLKNKKINFYFFPSKNIFFTYDNIIRINNEISIQQKVVFTYSLVRTPKLIKLNFLKAVMKPFTVKIGRCRKTTIFPWDTMRKNRHFFYDIIYVFLILLVPYVVKHISSDKLTCTHHDNFLYLQKFFSTPKRHNSFYQKI